MNYTIKKYPDGSSYVQVHNALPATFKINSYEDLWHLGQYVDAFNDKFKFEPNIIIPNLLDAQADRRFNKGESFGLKLVLNFLKGLKVNTYFIFHPHNSSVIESVLDNVVIRDNTEFIKNVLNEIYKIKNPTSKYDEGLWYHKKLFDDLVLMSSDAGSFKPLMELCDKIGWKGETFSASKARSWSEEDGTKFVQQIDREDFRGKDILLIDDLNIFGGTFKGLSKLLVKKNIGKIYLAVSHMTVQELDEYDSIFVHFDRVFTTNSKFEKYYLKTHVNELSNIPEENLTIIKQF